MSQTIVIKIGGVASQSLTDDFIEQVKAWKQAQNQIVIVHGGGFAINKLMEDNQVPVQKINGLRVTGESDMALVYQALVDIVGKGLTASLVNAGLPALQLTDQIKDLVQAGYLDKATYGFVGQASQINADALQHILQQGLIPLLASIGYAQDGQMLNINADYLATAVAIALKADKLIMMTDVKGVLENGQALDELKTTDVQAKIDTGVITGGMIPKIESAKETVLAGVKQVLIGDNLATGTVINK